MKIIIDKEIRGLIPPLTKEELAALDQSLKTEGCRDALILWKGHGILLDGHHRYEICNKNDIKFRTTEMGLADKNDAKIWVIENQFSRRNLPPYMRIVLASKLKDILAEKAKEHQNLNSSGAKTGLSTLTDRVEKPIDVRKEIAKIANVSEGTIWKVKKIEEKADEKTKEKLQTGEVTVSKVFNDITNLEKKNEEEKDAKIKAKEYKGIESIQITHGDFTKYGKNISDNSIDLVLTDPPYGGQYIQLWEEVAKLGARVLKPSGFLVAYSGQFYLPQVYDLVRKHLNYFWTIALKHTGHTAIISAVNVDNSWKPIVIYNKPPLKKPYIFKDLIEGVQGEKNLHEWAQSIDEARKLINIFSRTGDTILDPMAGSGTTLAAALSEKRKAIGIEIEEKNVNVIKARLSQLANNK